MPDLDQRVCPRCGAPAGGHTFCERCGCNLAQERRLPTRGEWELYYRDATAADAERAQQRLRAARAPFLVVLALVAIAAVVVLAAHHNVRAFAARGGSMEPTIPPYRRLGFEVSPTGRLRDGEVVVFHPPEGASSTAQPPMCGPVAHVITSGGPACAAPVPRSEAANFIKRIVAGPGDTVSIVQGHVIRNGVREQDSYIQPCGASAAPECNFPTPITIPAGDYFLLGDNRGVSDDSRFLGPVPRAWIIGKAVHCSFFNVFCSDAYTR